MCGILVVHSKKNKLNLERCNSALKRLSLRGPDYDFSSTYYNDSLFFGQTVLSITGDPKKHIDTYHHSANNRYDILLNGEIYNHTDLDQEYLDKKGISSLTKCDTETLVNLHQTLPPIDIFKSLRGMFAYVVYDNVSESLIIGRDIIGEKILYYYEDDNLLVISSEMGPILEIVPSIKINKEILKEYFFTRHLLAPVYTAFTGIQLIQPGHLLTYDLKNMKFEILSHVTPGDLVDLNIIENNKSRNSEDLVDELEGVFCKTAEALAPSIDYISVFSGGIDSSLASYFMQKCKPPKAFISLQFPDKDKTNLDMTGFEKKIGRKINTLKVDKNMFSNFFPECYKATCGPLSTHSFVSQAIMSHYVKNNNVKVLIGGDGADELFGGYEFYKTLDFTSNKFPINNPSIYSGYVPSNLEFDGWDSKYLKNQIKERWSNFSSLYNFEGNSYEKMLQTVLYSDTIIQLESVGIRAADTMSMVNSVESRSFFLSSDMIRFALNLPATNKIDLNTDNQLMMTKPLLKQLYIRCFGKSLLYPKQGFSGYPNEAAEIQLKNKEFNLTKDFLKISIDQNSNNNYSRSLKWKLMNVELFLCSFHQFI